MAVAAGQHERDVTGAVGAAGGSAAREQRGHKRAVAGAHFRRCMQRGAPGAVQHVHRGTSVQQPQRHVHGVVAARETKQSIDVPLHSGLKTGQPPISLQQRSGLLQQPQRHMHGVVAALMGPWGICSVSAPSIY